ncbi:uncharacterized protein LOC135713520 [Ochlerotatus camptorhynchus]|uniref:uncharacterized protein LOC135713520 n=1 Tax=Ochlerotatus camptorhynchus TaxID=644619 RepID=UPI0031E47EA4
MAPITRRTSVELERKERSRKAKLLFLQKRVSCVLQDCLSEKRRWFLADPNRSKSQLRWRTQRKEPKAAGNGGCERQFIRLDPVDPTEGLMHTPEPRQSKSGSVPTLSPAKGHEGTGKRKFLKTIPFENVKPLVKSLEYGFRYKTPNRGSKGVTCFYNCRRIKVHAKVQCNRKVMVFIPNAEKDECSVSIKGQHICNDMDSKSMAKMPLKQEDYNTINPMLHAG